MLVFIENSFQNSFVKFNDLCTVGTYTVFKKNRVMKHHLIGFYKKKNLSTTCESDFDF